MRVLTGCRYNDANLDKLGLEQDLRGRCRLLERSDKCQHVGRSRKPKMEDRLVKKRPSREKR